MSELAREEVSKASLNKSGLLANGRATYSSILLNNQLPAGPGG